jgi:hypothetical protein
LTQELDEHGWLTFLREWDAWFVGIKLPGARRYQSFQGLMVSLGNKRPEAAKPTR